MNMNTFAIQKLLRAAAIIGLLAVAVNRQAQAQTDYYNTDAGRPLTIEDAAATERYAFEIQLAPLRVERMKGGVYRWEIEPELAYGILPRTQLEISAPFSYHDLSSGSRSGLAGIIVSALHNLNTETAIPALAFAGSALLPVGSLAPDEAVFSAKAIATRTFSWARFHVNAERVIGGDDDESEGSHDWLAGIAVDRTFPLRSVLIGAELFARESATDGTDAEWSAAAGVRKQLSPSFNVDAGIGKTLNGDDRSWFVTIGLAHSFAIRSLMPGFRP